MHRRSKVSVGVAILALASASVYLAPGTLQSNAAGDSADTALSRESAVAVLSHLGITPEALVMAGASAAETEAIVATVTTESDGARDFLTKFEAVRSAHMQQRALQRELRTGGSTDERSSRHAQLQTDIAGAEAACSAAEATLREVLLENLPEHLQASLPVIMDNRRRKAPSRYRVLALNESDWTALESAIRKTSAQRELEPDENRVLALAEGSGAVATAASRIELDSGAIAMTMLGMQP